MFFAGDDDYFAPDLLYVLSHQITPNTQMVTSYMLAFEDGTSNIIPLARPHTGMWRRSYLIAYPFNEKLKSGIDREYIEETVKRGDHYTVIPYYFGYYYRKHTDYSCAGKIIFDADAPDIYVMASSPEFINPVVSQLKSKYPKTMLSTHKFSKKYGQYGKDNLV